jgi:hypothetical protein
LATGSAVSSPRRTGGGGTRPADAGPATCSCSGGHPHASAVSAVRTPAVRTPTLWTPTAVLGAAADSQGVRGVRFCSHPDTGRGVRLGQDGGGPAADVAAPRRDRACWICSSALVNWPGRRGQGRTAVRMLGHRTRPGEHREPARPGIADSRRGWGHCGSGTLGSRQRDRPPPGSLVRPERDPNVRHRPARPADRQIRSLGAAGNLASSCKAAQVGTGPPLGRRR